MKHARRAEAYPSGTAPDQQAPSLVHQWAEVFNSDERASLLGQTIDKKVL